MSGFNRQVVNFIPQLPGAYATAILTSDNTNVSVGETVTVGNKTYTFNTGVAGTAAFTTLTSDNTDVADGDTVTIGAQTYRFKNTIAQINDIHRTGTADTTLTNLVSAINGAGTAGTDYFTGTPVNSDVSAAAVSSHATVLTDKAVGTAGNAVATTTTATHVTFTGTTLAGGIDIINSILIGGSADASLTNLAAAINGTSGAGTTYGTGTIASTQVNSSAVATHALTLTALAQGAAANTIATTETSAHLSFGDTTMDGGIGGSLSGATIDAAGTYTTLPINVEAYFELIAFLNTTAHGGTTPTLDIKMQISPDAKNWSDSGDAFTQVTTTNSVTFKKIAAQFGKWVRFILVTAGTLPTYTFDLTLVAKM